MQGAVAGLAFEHFILMELVAFLGLNELDSPINYFRTNSGLEVDFILNEGDCAIEVKITENPALSDLKGLRAFCKDYKPKHALVVCLCPRRRLLATVNGVDIVAIPWQIFLKALWEREYF